MLTKADRITGGLIGLLVGDALGVPYEFHAAKEIPPLAQIEMEPPIGFARSHRTTPIGTWSDDGAQALCLLASLLDCNCLDPDDLGRRLVDWYDRGYMAVDGKVFDVGIHTARVVHEISRGMPVLAAGALGNQARGNGSLMRVLPLVLWHRGSDESLVADAHLQSRVTHGDSYCQICCALYCLWARRMLEQSSDPWQQATVKLRQIYTIEPSFLDILDWAIRPDDEPDGRGGGYVIDCLRSARMVMSQSSYELVVKRAVALGDDTDTTACVAGGVAGLRDGIGAITTRWRELLRGMEIVNPLLDLLVQQHF
ncbi:ADP-ribosylglycohydrolase family protein [Chamaesiphon sp. VAR_48_metabat_403]|uniref:ADP-ribosylglycohydrolase family protein n=1 Tax=Chamaesiphon sp. VAR_48_metabat_403 TaxID=2964700 RepID=UPI00286DFF88|nr:ADP-ribosylglycohydrolase family protein [Chamaesiphon sp. VAR_48_metabat_403]